jgi:predicted transcriptional regulator
MPYITSAERIGIEKGRDEGLLLNAREMVLEALDVKFSSTTPEDIKQQIQALNNRIMLKKLHKSAIQSKDIEDFRKSMKELTAEA